MSKKTDAIVSVNTSLSQIQNQFEIAGKVLGAQQTQKDRETLIQLCDFLNISLKDICSHKFRFDLSLIREVEDKINWGRLSNNPVVLWTADLIEHYEDKWDWDNLSYNPSLPWSTPFLIKYRDRWEWGALLLENKGINWTHGLRKFVQKEAHLLKIDQEDLDSFLSQDTSDTTNDQQPDPEEMDSYSLSISTKIPWTAETIRKYRNRLYWDLFSLNPSVPWTIELIQEFENLISWKYLSWNTGLPWSKEFVQTFLNQWNWEYLSANPSWPLNLDFYETFEDNFVKECLFWNKDSDFDRRFSSMERSDLIEAGEHNLELLIGQYSIQPEFLEKYQDMFDWSYISRNRKITWFPKLLEQYRNKIDWNGLISDPNLWDLQTLSKYKNEIKGILPFQTRRVTQHISKIFLQIANEEFVRKIFSNSQQKLQ